MIEVGGIGILTLCSPDTVAGLRVGQPTTLATSLIVREDSLTLYGFASGDEREFFELLLTATGVGPKLAQAALAVLSPDELRRAIATENLVLLCKVPGIGRKGAQRIVIELKDKINTRRSERGAGTDRRRAGTVARSGDPGSAESRLVGQGRRCGLRRHRAPGPGGSERERRRPDAGRPADPGPEVVPPVHQLNDEELAALVRPDTDPDERAAESALRPSTLADFEGQPRVSDQLGLVLEAARNRGGVADHVLLSGPPGLGKTTLAMIIASLG